MIDITDNYKNEQKMLKALEKIKNDIQKKVDALAADKKQTHGYARNVSVDFLNLQVST